MNYILTLITYEDLVTSLFDICFLLASYRNIVKLKQDKALMGFDYRNFYFYISYSVWQSVVIYPNANLYLANVINICYIVSAAYYIYLLHKYKK